MTRYSKSFLFPDLNVWIALTYTKHAHYTHAHRWFNGLSEEAQLCFCRFTQIGFLRLLTTSVVMGDEVLGQNAAWGLYDDWIREGGATYLEEPASLEHAFRLRTLSRRAAAKEWADSYLAAFAETAELYLVTFDQSFEGKLKRLTILRP
jgi:uncharacterized protein